MGRNSNLEISLCQNPWSSDRCFTISKFPRCNLSVLCDSVVVKMTAQGIHDRVTENSEVAQRSFFATDFENLLGTGASIVPLAILYWLYSSKENFSMAPSVGAFSDG
jgi:hypothetical protein